MIYSKKRSMLKYLDYVPFGSDKQKRKLVNSLYHTFRTNILPSISISVFHKHFSADNGRPTKGLQFIIGLFLLQALKNLTDEETKLLYGQNAGGQAAFSIVKRRLGQKRLRRGGMANTTLSVILATTALNVIRMHQWLVKGPLGTQFSKNKADLSRIYRTFFHYLTLFIGCAIIRRNMSQNRPSET